MTTPEELALLWGTFMVGRWAEVMASDTEPPDDWQEAAAAEAVALFRPALGDVLATEAARVLRSHADGLIQETCSGQFNPNACETCRAAQDARTHADLILARQAQQ